MTGHSSGPFRSTVSDHAATAGPRRSPRPGGDQRRTTTLPRVLAPGLARKAATALADHHLAEVLASEHGEEGVHGVVDPLEDGLLEGDPAVADPAAHVGGEGAE